MGVVKPLAVAETIPDEDVVKALEESLERAKKGEVLAVAIVEVWRAGDVMFHATHKKSYHQLNSGAARLSHYLSGVQD